MFKLIQNLGRYYQKSLTVLETILIIAEVEIRRFQRTLNTLSSDNDDVSLAPLFSVIDDDEDDEILLAQLVQNERPALSASEADQFIGLQFVQYGKCFVHEIQE